MSENNSPNRGGIWPWIVLAIFTLLFAIKPFISQPKAKEGELDVHAFGKLPILLNGRIQPLDSVARNHLLQIAGQTRIALDGNGPNKEWGDLYELSEKHNGEGLFHIKFYQRFNKRPRKLHPTEWLLEVLMQPEVADRRFIFRIDHPDLLSELQLEMLGIDKSGLRFYNFEQLRPYVMLLHKKGRAISEKPQEKHDPYEKAAIRLTRALELYIQLRHSVQPNHLDLSVGEAMPTGVPDYAATLEEMQVAATELQKLIAERRETKADDDPWPHLFEAFEWSLKEKSFEKGEVPEATYIRAPGPAQEAQLLGNMFYHHLQGGNRVSAKDLQPGNEADLADKIGMALQALLEAQQNNPEFANFAHVIQDYLSLDQEAQGKVGRYLMLVEGPLQVMESQANLMMIPPAKKLDEWGADPWGWKKTATALTHGLGGTGKVPVPIQLYGQMSQAYNARSTDDELQPDVESFNNAVGEYRDWLADQGFAVEVKKGREEHFFNTFAPFARAQGIYVITLLLACFSWLKMSRGLINSALYLVGLAAVLHTFGLIFRMYLEGRPPVTNLYSSAVFVGWGAVILGWVLERIYRNGIGSFVASLVGFSTLLIAGHLAEEGDTMEMMRAVLDTNFWLATHVVTITIGYSATFLAGFLAIVYVLRGVFTPSLAKETAGSLVRMIYGIVCFATLFSFVGTVLGGIWADQSWGRFWGWDSKENGALMIVVWNAIILHCRWGGYVKDRGLVILALFGNIVTAWSWFGVNMLGIGLHSYGFMDSAFHSLRWFAVVQILLMLAASQPLMHWLSAANIAKTQNRLIAMLSAGIIGVGILLQLGAFWTKEKGGLLSILGCALVVAGLILSYMPAHVTGTSPKKVT